MKEFVVYSKDACPYCEQAKALLTRKGREFQELKLERDLTREEVLEAIQYYGHGRTMPMIIRHDDNGNTERVGGYQELVKFFETEEK